MAPRQQKKVNLELWQIDFQRTTIVNSKPQRMQHLSKGNGNSQFKGKKKEDINYILTAIKSLNAKSDS